MKVKKPLLGIRITGGLEGAMTAWAGISPLMMLERKCGLVEIADKVLPVKKSPKGLQPGEMVESFILLSAMGGEYLEDMERLRQEGGLAAMPGYISHRLRRRPDSGWTNSMRMRRC